MGKPVLPGHPVDKPLQLGITGIVAGHVAGGVMPPGVAGSRIGFVAR